MEMDQANLAAAASVSRGVVIDFEKGKRVTTTNNLAAIRRALESAGVEFTNGDQPGVRMKRTAGDPDSIPHEELNASNDD